MASPYPVRAVQRNLHHQLLRSVVLITGSSRRPGMHLRDRAFARHERRARCGGDALVPSGLLHPRAGEVLEY
jgi:hypothetical protein